MPGLADRWTGGAWAGRRASRRRSTTPSRDAKIRPGPWICGRRESFGKPVDPGSRPGLCRQTETPNSSRSPCTRSTGGPRTTLSGRGFGPAATAAASAMRRPPLGTGALPVDRPARAIGIEPVHPVAQDPQCGPAKPRRMTPRSAVPDRRGPRKTPASAARRGSPSQAASDHRPRDPREAEPLPHMASIAVVCPWAMSTPPRDSPCPVTPLHETASTCTGTSPRPRR